MEAAEALAELAEISTALEAAVLVDESGRPLAATPGAEKRADALARIATELVERAHSLASDSGRRLTQLEVATPVGSVFVVCGDDRLLAGTTGPVPPAGLVLYDLRTALRKAGDEA